MTTTSEGTGNGAVERAVPRIYNHQILKEIQRIKKIAEDPPAPSNIDGGELSMLSALSDEDINIILRAADILKKIR